MNINQAGAVPGADASWHKCRQETPGCQHVVHFNNAGAALQPKPVIEAVQHYIEEEAVYGGYEVAARRKEDLQRPYKALARLLNCSPQEVFFGIPFKPGDVILTSQAEYGSNYLAYLQAQKRFGVQIKVVPETADGDIDMNVLQELLAQQPKPALVSITHVPTSSGRVYDAAAVGAAAAVAGVPFLLDACQSAGQMPLDVQQLQCDFLTGTSRKYLRGPRGIGFLYARSQNSSALSNTTTRDSGSAGRSPSITGWEPAMIDIHGAEWLSPDSYRVLESAESYEQYEVSFVAKVGFGVAVEYCLQQDLPACWQRIQQLSDLLRHQLTAAVPGLTLQDKGRHLCGIVSFTLASHPDTAAIRSWLAAQQPPINVTVSGIGSTRLDFEQRGLKEVVRASVSYYNNEDDIQQLVCALQRLAGSNTAAL